MNILTNVYFSLKKPFSTSIYIYIQQPIHISLIYVILHNVFIVKTLSNLVNCAIPPNSNSVTQVETLVDIIYIVRKQC